MKGAPRSLPIPGWKLPGVRARQRERPPSAELGVDRAVVVFCMFAAPPALVLAGLIHAGQWPVGFWLAACAYFFTGLTLALRLEPMPPRRVFDPSAFADPVEPPGHGDEIEMRPILGDAESSVLDLPGIAPGMSTPEVLEQLAKLREQGDLSGNEYHRALARLDLGERSER